MNLNRSALDLWVGTFVAIGIGAVLFLALKVGNLISFGSTPGYRLEARFDGFLRTWMRNYQAQNGALAATLHFLSPPLHAYVFSTRPPEQTYQGEPGVRKIEVEFERVLFDGNAFHDLDRRVIREVTMEP